MQNLQKKYFNIPNLFSPNPYVVNPLIRRKDDWILSFFFHPNNNENILTLEF